LLPHKTPAGGGLSQTQLCQNHLLSQNRVIIENYFGRLSAKFHILVRLWAFAE
jgi:hypothetical protein